MTIPVSQIVNTIPSVLSAGGAALDLVGIALTTNTRVPIGTIQSFASLDAVENYFGDASAEAAVAAVYFAGFTNCTKLPGALYFAQYPESAVSAYLRGGNVSVLTIPQLQAITGSMSITVDGATRNAASISLSAATSFTAAAALIQAALNTTEPVEASVTGSIAPGTFSATASISGPVMNVTQVASGSVVPGATVTGANILAGTTITSQLSGTPGGVGAYAISSPQNVPSESPVTGTYGTLTVTAVTSGTISPGQTLTGTGVTAGTLVTGYGTGSGLAGTYYVSPTQTTASGAISASATNLVVSFDSTSGGFVITSGIAGAPSTIAYPTGTIVAPLLLGQANGAILSQGANEAQPGPFMDSIVRITTNWATFFTMFDPDAGSGYAQKMLFSNWVNAQNNRYAYIAKDNDISPTLATPASTSFGYALRQNQNSGTAIIWEPAGPSLYGAAFMSGFTASIDFDTPNGRATAAFKKQSGLIAGVTDGQVAINLAGNPQVAGDYGNGYNFIGAYATAAQNYIWLQRGTVSGEFLWWDSYVDQIWLNAQIQLVLATFLDEVNSIPYNQAGYTAVEEVCQGPMNQALYNGVARAGVTLSDNQIIAVNTTAGAKISDILQQRGWYVQVLDAEPIVRQGRSSPPFKIWYCDGESIQAFTVSTINVQ